VIPDADVPELSAAGVAAVFGPGTPINVGIESVLSSLEALQPDIDGESSASPRPGSEP
jgi:methylmalonyl-CoA mutase cobalamin-binding domain/chain